MKRLVAAVSLVLFVGCTAPITASEVAELMAIQRQAWNRGDLETFVAYYDESMTFSGGSGITRGTNNLLARYKKGYPTAKERGVLTFEVLDVRPLGDATALVLGRYAIARDDPASGFFSLLVKRMADGVRIIHDHTSATEMEQ